MSKIAKLAANLAVLSMFTFASSAWAAPINSPLPTNTYITFNGADWAWASPCSPGGCYNGADVLDLSYQGTQGWRFPTLAELVAGPAPTDFLFSGANVPFGGVSIEGTSFGGVNLPPGDGACATAYFTNASFNLCNYGDAIAGALYGLDNIYAGTLNVDTWLIRDVVAVPEPVTITIFGVGLAGAAAIRRRRKKSA